MSSLKSTLAPELGRAKDLLLDVGLLLEQTPSDQLDGVVAEMDLKLRTVYGIADATRRLLVLFREPVVERYDPAGAVRAAAAQPPVLPPDTGTLRAVRMCDGDAEQVVECMKVITSSVTLGHEERLTTRVLTGEEPPRVELEYANGGEDGPLSIDGIFTLTWEDLSDRWTAATQGGRLARGNGGVTLVLEGEQAIPVSMPGLEEALRHAKRLVSRLRSWRGAIGHYEPGYGAPEEIAALYKSTVGKAMEEVDGVLGKV